MEVTVYMFLDYLELSKRDQKKCLSKIFAKQYFGSSDMLAIPNYILIRLAQYLMIDYKELLGDLINFYIDNNIISSSV